LCIGSEISYGDQFFNNIAVGIAQDAGAYGTDSSPDYVGCAYQYGGEPNGGNVPGYCLQWNDAYVGGSYTPSGGMTATPQDAFKNNVAYCSGPIAASDACHRADTGDTWEDGAAGGVVTTTPWANVGNTSPGTETTVPNGYNFAITSGNTVGNGVHWNYLLPPHDEDLGACYHTLTSCP
jgi:hypothetical protein